MAGAFLPEGSAALIAAFTAILLPGAETVSDPKGPERQRRMAAGQLFCFAMQSRPSLKSNKTSGRRRKIVDRRHSKPDQGGGSFA
jgi:hypothetical protein